MGTEKPFLPLPRLESYLLLFYFGIAHIDWRPAATPAAAITATVSLISTCKTTAKLKGPRAGAMWHTKKDERWRNVDFAICKYAN